ncbi:MAG: hypothetical protein Kow0090_04930 [Myxococcota bacterium]
MKQMTLQAVKSLLEGAEFKKWWGEFESAVKEFESISHLHDELLAQNNLLEFRAELASKNAVELLYRAGEYEDAAAALLAEASTIDNQSFEALGNFEEQRIKVSEIWFKLGALEQSIDEFKERLSELNKKLEATSNAAEKATLQNEIARIKEEGNKFNKQARKLAEIYEKESVRKKKLWEEVKRFWDKLLEINLAAQEKQQKASREKRRSEELFKQGELNKQRAQRSREEIGTSQTRRNDLEDKIRNLYRDARQKFDCIVEEDFLYWPKRGNNKVVYCVPLISNSDGYNMEIEKLVIYQVNRQNGVKFIEPVLEDASVAAEDKRIDDFFMDRPGYNIETGLAPLNDGGNPGMEKTELDKRAVLEGSKLFENLLHEELEMLANLAVERRYFSGDVLFKQGDTGNSLYVLVEGEVEVLIKLRGEEGEKPIASIKAPEFFGEMSLIDKEVRSATIKAKTDVTCLILSTQNLHSFAKVYKNGFTMIVINIARVMSQRLRGTNAKLAEVM